MDLTKFETSAEFQSVLDELSPLTEKTKVHHAEGFNGFIEKQNRCGGEHGRVSDRT